MTATRLGERRQPEGAAQTNDITLMTAAFYGGFFQSTAIIYKPVRLCENDFMPMAI